MDNVQALTGTNLTTFLLVLVALAGLFILFSNVVEAARKLRKPQERHDHRRAGREQDLRQTTKKGGECPC